MNRTAPLGRSTVSSRLGVSSPRRRRQVLGALAVLLAAQLRMFLTLERDMRRTGGPGIIPFELAGTTDRAQAILDTWGAPGRAAARSSLLLDYIFPPTYASLQAFACDAAADGLARRHRRRLAALGRRIAWGQFAAAAFDYAENTALLLLLAGRQRRTPRVARTAALAKFAVIGFGQVYFALAAIDAGLARWRAARSSDAR